MKMQTLTHSLTVAALGAACLFTFPDSAQAKDKDKGKGNSSKSKDKHEGVVSSRGASAFTPGRSGNLPPGQGGVPPGQLKKTYNDTAATAQRYSQSAAAQRYSQADAARRYSSVPRSSFVLSLGDGYAGRGYYYGPRDMPYYYENPYVRYYRTRELAPREYWGNDSRYDRHGSLDAQVQSELARRGYYRGPIDGDIGPGSRAAIARYQAERGLRVTGGIDGSLLASLGLR